MKRRQRLVAGLAAAVAIAGAVALVWAETTREWDEVGETSTAQPATPFYRYLEMPPGGNPAHYPPRILCNGSVAESVYYRGWVKGWFTAYYIQSVGLYGSSYRDYDRFRDWDDYANDWGDWLPYGDSSIYTDHWYFPAWAEEIQEPVTIEFQGRWLDQIGSEQDANSQDYPGPHTVVTHVVNSTLPGFSYIWTDRWQMNGRRLSSRALGAYPGSGPYPYSEFDGGQVHIEVGETTWLREHRHVRSFQVDAHECDLTTLRLDEGADDYWYYYAAVDDPGNGRDAYRSTTAPGYYTHQRDHVDIARDHMLEPAYQPLITGRLAVCDATFVHPMPPRQGDPPVEVGYDLLPNEMFLCPVFQGGQYAVELRIWYPLAPNYARLFYSNDTSGRFQWDGVLYGDYGSDPNDTAILATSDYFMRVTWYVSDYFWADGEETYNLVCMSCDEFRVIFERMWETANKANQIYNPTWKDDPPEIPRNVLYMADDPTNSYKYRLSLDCRMPSSHARSGYACAAIEAATNVQRSGSFTPFPAVGPANMAFSDPSPGNIQDFHIVVGRDVNYNGVLEPAERLSLLVRDENGEIVGSPVLRGTDWGRYNTGLAWVDDKFQAWYTEILWPIAGTFLGIFRHSGTEWITDPTYRPDGVNLVSLECLSQGPPPYGNQSDFREWLTHNCGAEFTASGAASIVEYEWDANSEPGIVAGVSVTLQEPIRNYWNQSLSQEIIDEVRQYFYANPQSLVAWFPLDGGTFVIPYTHAPSWVTPVTVDFGGYSLPTDLGIAIGRARLREHRARFKLYRESGYVRVDEIQHMGELTDLYDFNQEAPDPAPEAASVQIGFGNGSYGVYRTSGRICRHRIHVDKTYTVPANSFMNITLP